MVKLSPNDPCPCTSGKKYKKCCRPYHVGNQRIPTPEALVRARYAAYALANVDFIMQTTHPDGPKYDKNAGRWRAALDAYCFRNSFPNLETLSAEEDKVTYRAEILEYGTRKFNVIEHCIFQQIDGRWLYFDGEMEEIKADS